MNGNGRKINMYIMNTIKEKRSSASRAYAPRVPYLLIDCRVMRSRTYNSRQP